MENINFNKQTTDQKMEEAMKALDQKVMKGVHEFEINGKKFKVTKWKNRKALAWMPVLADLLVVPMTQLWEDSGASLEGFDVIDQESGQLNLFNAVQLLVSKLLYDRPFEPLVEGLLEDVQSVDNNYAPVDIDEHFEDSFEVIQCVTEVLKVNFMSSGAKGMLEVPVKAFNEIVKAKVFNSNLESM